MSLNLTFRVVEEKVEGEEIEDEAETDKLGSISIEKRQSESLERFSLKLERQFLYLVRHNPTGMLVMIGRYFHPPDSSNAGDHHHHDEHHHDHEEHHHHSDGDNETQK
jgi:hypothetical protein